MAGASRSNETDAARPMAAIAPYSRNALSQTERQVAGPELGCPAGQGRPGEGPEREATDDDRDEQEGGDGERRVHAAARDRSGEQHLQGPALALAGDGVDREAEGEDEAQPDRERVDEPERDRAGQREDVAPAEVGELLRDEPGVHHLLELLAERVVDDRQEGAPQEQRDRDDEQPQPVGAPDVCANRARFTRRHPRSTRGTLPPGWPARWSGRGRSSRRSPPGTARPRRPGDRSADRPRRRCR